MSATQELPEGTRTGPQGNRLVLPRVGETSAEEFAAFVRRYPDVLDELLFIWNRFDLGALKSFFAGLDVGRPWSAGPLKHARYTESREEISRLLQSDGAHSDATRGYLARAHVNRVYSASAENYDQLWDSIWTYENRRMLVSALEAAEGDSILEIGVGTGNNFKHLPQGCRVTGVDFSPSMLEICRAKLEAAGHTGARLMNMDAHNLTFEDGEFNKVLCFYTLCAVEDPFRVLSEAARVTAPGGHVVIYDVVYSDIPEVALLQYVYRPIARELGAIYLEFCPPGSIAYDPCLDIAEPIAAAGLTPRSVSFFDPFRTVLLGVYEKAS